MKKKLLGIIISLAMVVTMIPVMGSVAYAADDEVTNIETEYGNMIIENGVLVEYTGGDEYLEIPEGITAIGEYAFYNNTVLKSVSIPDSVTSLGYCAFVECHNLEQVIIGKNITEIGAAAFQGCMSLAEVNLPDGLTTIKNDAFSNCDSLTGIVIPAGVTTIGIEAFGYCDGLTQIDVDERNANFYASDNVVYSKAGELVFCPVTRVGAFVVPDCITVIRRNAFSNCSNLSEITLPDGLVSIGAKAFIECDNLTSITLPASLQKIENNAFFSSAYDLPFTGGSTKLTDIYYAGTQAQWNNIEIIYGNKRLEKATLHCAPCTNHDYSDYVSNGDGTHEVICKDCSKVQDGHDKDTCINTAVVTDKATLTENGKVETKCTKCDFVSKTTTIYYPKTFTLSSTSCEYTGSQIKPTITIKDSNGATVASTNYTVTYGTNKLVGKGTVKVTFKGNYTGTKTVEFNITPKKTTIGTPAIASDGITVKWTKNTTGSGYYIYRSINGAGYTKVKTITSNATVSWKDTGAKTNSTKYQYKIYAYKTVSSTTYKSPVSSVKTTYFVSRPTISSLTAGTEAFTVKWGKNSKATGYQIQYSTKSDFSSGNKTVTVTSASTVSKKISSLTATKKYYVRVRSYKTVSSTKYYSAWSASKAITTK